MEINFLATLQSSFTMVILLGCSIVVLTFIFERLFYLKHTSVDADRFFGQVREAVRTGGAEAGISMCNTSSSPLAVVVKTGLEEKSGNPKAAAEMMDAAAIEQRFKLEKNLNVLGTLGNISPLIGLFGTIVGIIRAFHALAVSGSAGPSVISAGIAEALITTAAGLVVAVPAVIFYNYFLRKTDNVMTGVESARKRLLVMLEFSN
ncbi:MAG: MotA/TolQ/ExbB proton channel family protein [bacterium]